MLSPRSLTRRATPSLLAPHQLGRPPEHRQVNQHDLTDTMTMRSPFAARRPLRVDRDHDAQPLRPLADTDHTHRGQADQQRAHARSIRFQAGAPRDSMTLDTVENHRAPAPRPGSPPETDVTTSSHPQIRSAGLAPAHGVAEATHSGLSCAASHVERHRSRANPATAFAWSVACTPKSRATSAAPLADGELTRSELRDCPSPMRPRCTRPTGAVPAPADFTSTVDGAASA